MLEGHRDSKYDSDDSDSSDASSTGSISNESDAEFGSPAAKRPWLSESTKSAITKDPDGPQSSMSASSVQAARLAAGEAWRKAFQEGVMDSQLSKAVGFVSGGVPNLDRETEAYNYKLAPRLPNKGARKAKRRADLEAISAAVAAGHDDYSIVADQQLELEEFGLPSSEQPVTAAQVDLRLRLQAKNRKRNIQKRLGKQRKHEAQAQGVPVVFDSAVSSAAASMDVDEDQRKSEHRQQHRDKLDPSAPPHRLARRLASLLKEPKRHLLDRVVSELGASKAVELYRRTEEVEAAGGLLVANGNRRRTPGGVYLQLMKSEDSVTPDMLRRIFDGEADAAKDKRKRLRATRRRRPRKGRGENSESVDEAAELEKKRTELLAQLDALDEAD